MTTPDSLPNDVQALQALLMAERARHAEELDRLTAIIKELQRHRFGRRSEQLDPDQLALALEDLEQTIAATEAAAEKDGEVPAKPAAARKRQINRGALPVHLPREEIVIDVEDKTCACCGGLKHRIGEDVSERLDVIPAQLKVIVTRRPKYACRACAGEVTQAPAPERLIESGIPTEALIAHVLVAKYADHTPLYRQAQIYARQGITLDRSTLADWVGRAAFALRPVHARLFELLKQSSKLFADETTAPALDPVESDIRGVTADERRRVRQLRTKPIIDALRPWLEAKLATVSGKSTIAEAIRYALSRWDGLTRFLDDGRIEIDSNVVERAIRPIALGRKNHLFAGSDGGGAHWAVIASLIETCKMNDVDPEAYLRDVLTNIVARHPMSRIDELLPFAYAQTAESAAA